MKSMPGDVESTRSQACLASIYRLFDQNGGGTGVGLYMADPSFKGAAAAKPNA